MLAGPDDYVSMASSVALEHAARDIGIKANLYSERQLRRNRTKGQSLLKEKNFWTVKTWL